MKDKLKLNQDFINFCIDFFEQEYYVNFFSNKYVYLSQNFDSNLSTYYQLIGDLGGVPVNSWKEESKQSSVFIISESDMNSFKSKEVLYIQDLINKKQTIKDTNANILSSEILILPLETFLNYCKERKAGNIKTTLLITDKTKKSLYDFKTKGLQYLLKQ